MMCEKCWEEAYNMMKYIGASQTECYVFILKYKEEYGDICSPREQAGQFWDEELKIDRRSLKKEKK